MGKICQMSPTFSKCLRHLELFRKFIRFGKQRLPLLIPDICYQYHLWGKQLVMWRNFRFQYMTDVEKSEISPHVEEFPIFPHNRCEEI